MDIADLPLSCTIGDRLRRMGEDRRGLSGLGKVNHHLVREVVLRDKRNSYTLDVDATIIETDREIQPDSGV